MSFKLDDIIFLCYMEDSEDYLFTSVEHKLTNSSQQASVTVPVMDDNQLEINETFRADISVTQKSSKNCIVLQPGTADVTIVDNDS